jgi:hypothetical protein
VGREIVRWAIVPVGRRVRVVRIVAVDGGIVMVILRSVKVEVWSVVPAASNIWL